MKRILAIVLALMLLCSMAGCSTTTNPPAGEVNDTQQTPSDTSGTTNSSTDQTESDQQSDEPITFGATNGTNYENKSLKLGIHLDDTWTYATKEQLAQLAGLAAEMVSEDVAETMENANVVYDMQAVAADGSTNILINYENIGAIYGTLLTESAYIDLALKNLETSLSGSAMTLIDSKKQTFTIDGKEFQGIKLHSTSSGIDLYQAILCIKAGNYMSSVTITTPLEDKTDDILAKFYTL